MRELLEAGQGLGLLLLAPLAVLELADIVGALATAYLKGRSHAAH